MTTHTKKRSKIKEFISRHKYLSLLITGAITALGSIIIKIVFSFVVGFTNDWNDLKKDKWKIKRVSDSLGYRIRALEDNQAHKHGPQLEEANK